jgi:O-antigen/teichoic acid export membrane protein
MGDNFLSRLSGNIYLSNITWLMAERVVRLLVTAFVGIYVARYLGPQRFGLLSFSQSYVAIFIILATLGLDGIVIRELVNRPTERAEILGTAFILKALGCVLMWVVLGFSLMLFNVQGQESLLVSILAIGVIFQAFSVIDFFFQARVESRYVARAQLAQLVLSSTLKLYLVTVSAELVWFAVVLTLDHLFLAVGLYVVYRAKGGEVSTWHFRAPLAREMLVSSAPIMFYAFFVLALMNSDQIMVKVLRGDTEVGWYSAAAMIASLWYFIPVALGSTFNPYIISHARKWKADEKIKLLFSALSALALAGVLAVFFLAPVIIRILFGEAYAPAGPVLAILILNGIFVFHVSIRSRVLVALEKQLSSTIIMLGALVLNIIGNLVLIPRYGAEGAAWSSVIAWGASVIVFPIAFSVTRPFIRMFVTPQLSGVRELISALKS